MERPNLATCTDAEFEAYETWLNETLTAMVEEAKTDSMRRWAVNHRTWKMRMLRADRYKALQPKPYVRIG